MTFLWEVLKKSLSGREENIVSSSKSMIFLLESRLLSSRRWETFHCLPHIKPKKVCVYCETKENLSISPLFQM